jgi:hypothetical protein
VRILAIDPGHTTGWCKIDVEDEKPKYVFSGNVDAKRGNLVHCLRGLLSTDTVDHYVIERLPYRIPPILSEVRLEILGYLTDKTPNMVGPAEWKPITGRYPLPKLDWRTTQHERDAWRMGVFWLWKEGLIRLDTVPRTK